MTIGCGGSSSGASSPSGTGAADVPFHELGPAERKQYMQAVVVPAMAKTFKAGPEPEHFEKVGCTTCHGASAKAGNFAMPAPDLPRFASFEDAMKEHPEMTRFMAEKIVPEMARLLSEEPFDPNTGKGFGCFGCHMKPD